MSHVIVALALIAFTAMEFQSPRTEGAGDEVSRRIMVPIVLAMLSGLLLILLPRILRFPRHLVTPSASVFFLCFVGWTAFSAIWSAYPADSMVHLGLTLLGFLVAVGLATVPPRTTAFIFMALGTLMFAVTWVGLAAGLPMLSDNPTIWRLCGFMLHEQRLALMGAAVAILGTVMLVDPLESRTNKRILAGMVLFALVTMLATQARFFSAACIVVLACILAWGNRDRVHRIVLVGFPIAVTGFLMLLTNLELFARGTNDLTLTGRIPVWEMTIGKIAQDPLVGHGLGSFRFSSVDVGAWAPAHAHNMWLNVAFEQGIPAALFLTLFLGAAMLAGRRLAAATGRPSFLLPLAAYITICGIMGIVVGARLSPLYGLMLVLMMQELHQWALIRDGRGSRTAFPLAMRGAAGFATPQPSVLRAGVTGRDAA